MEHLGKGKLSNSKNQSIVYVLFFRTAMEFCQNNSHQENLGKSGPFKSMNRQGLKPLIGTSFQ